MKNFKLLALFLTTSLVVTSCSNDDNAAVNEEELITTVTTTLVGGGQTIILTSKDLDGVEGPNAPVFTTTGGDLVAGRTYTGSTTFLNESVSPAEDITEEVSAEGADHQVFYQLPATLGTITYDDVDANGKPIGLAFTFLASAAGNGNLTITLRHLPNKSAVGVSDGDITNAGGNTDAEVTFPVRFQ